MFRPSRVLLLGLLLTGCKKAGAPDAAVDIAQTEAASAAQTEAASAGGLADRADLPEEGVLVQLLSPGAEPRSELRFSPGVGPQGTLSMSMDMNLTMLMAGMEIPVQMPQMTFDMGVDVTEVQPNGDIIYAATVDSVTVAESELLPGAAIDELRSGLSALVGSVSTVRINDRGSTLSSEFTGAADAPPELQEQINTLNKQASNLSVPLPSEAVGVGGSWEVLSIASTNGVRVAQRTVVTLMAHDGGTAVFATTIEQVPADGTLQLPDLPPGAEVEVKRFDSSGTGTATNELDSLVPVVSSTELTLGMQMIVSTPEAPPQDFGMNMDMVVRTERK